MTGRVQVGGLDFEVRRSGNRHTLGITVDRNGELVAHSPMETSSDELVRWIQGKLLWVHRKLALKETSFSGISGPQYISGESFSYLGRRYPLKLVEEQKEPLRLDGARFLLRRDARPADAHFRKWYIATGSDWLRRRTATLSRRTASEPKRVDVRDLGYRWGSCGKNGVLYFNWKLLQLPKRLVDYVILHELIHLRQSHHGHAFSSALTSALPDWQERKNTLADRAKEYLVFGLTR